MDLNLTNGALLLLIAAVVAMLTRRLHLPYSVGLVTAGIAIALVPFAPEINLTKDLLFTVLLPPLIFEAAFCLDWGHLRRELPVVLLLATIGVLLSAAVTAAGMHYLANWQWAGAIVFGVLIAATDPVSVIATFREAKAQGRLLLLIESESLFNDGTAAVFFVIALEVVTGGSITTSTVLFRLVTMTLGSLVCGGAVAVAMALLCGRSDDHLVEITCTTLAAWGSFLLAEHFHFSGVLATLTAGLIFGNAPALASFSERGREAVDSFWEYAAFVANSLVFLLIGIRVAHQNVLSVWTTAAAAIGVVIVARAAAVYPSCVLFARSNLRVTMRHQNILLWGGLRGALALALALALPSELPGRAAIVSASFAVVAFSVFVQGLTLTPLLRAWGEIKRAPGTSPRTY